MASIPLKNQSAYLYTDSPVTDDRRSAAGNLSSAAFGGP